MNFGNILFGIISATTISLAIILLILLTICLIGVATIKIINKIKVEKCK